MSWKTEEAIETMILAGTKAAATTGGYKGVLHLFPGIGQIAQLALAGVEVGVLTKVTTNMCKNITKIYNYENISGISAFIGVVVGAATGGLLANKVVELIPGVGAAASAVATFSLHALTGIVITSICELIDEGIINENDINSGNIKAINKLLNLLTGVVSDIARGYSSGGNLKAAFSEAIKLTKNKIEINI